MEEEGEMAVKRAGDEGQSRLTRHRRRGEDVGRLPSRSERSGDLIRQWVTDELEERKTTSSCKKTEKQLFTSVSSRNHTGPLWTYATNTDKNEQNSVCFGLLSSQNKDVHLIETK